MRELERLIRGEATAITEQQVAAVEAELHASPVGPDDAFIIDRNGCRYVVRANCADVRQFLESTLCPYFRCDPVAAAPDQAARLSIRCMKVAHLAVDLRFVRALAALSIVHNPRDQRKNETAGVMDVAGYRLFWMPTYSVLMILSSVTMRLAIVGEVATAVSACCRLVIRDSTNVHLINAGHVEVHASAVSDGHGRVTVIAGSQNSGKSTLLFYFLSRGHTLVSNGRVYVRRGVNGLRVLGTPESIYIRPFTANLFPQLRPLLDGAAPEEIAARECELKHKIKIEFKELCARFDADIEPEGDMVRLILPRLSLAESTPSATHFNLAADGSHLFDYASIKRREWFGIARIDREQYERNIRDVLEDMHSFESMQTAYVRNGEYVMYSRGQAIA